MAKLAGEVALAKAAGPEELSPLSMATTASQQELSCSEEGVELPTLLASRPQATASPEALKKPGVSQKLRPPAVATEPCPGTEEFACVVHNTFIEYRGLQLLSPLAEDARQLRTPLTCPAARAGRLAGLFLEADAATPEFVPLEDIPPSPMPWGCESPEQASAGLPPKSLQSSLSCAAAVFVPGQCQHSGANVPGEAPGAQLRLTQPQPLQHTAPLPRPQPAIAEAGSRVASGVRGVFSSVPSMMMPVPPPMAPPVMPQQASVAPLGVSAPAPPPALAAPRPVACHEPCAPPPFSPRGASGRRSLAGSPTARSPGSPAQAAGAAPTVPPGAAPAAELPSIGSYLHGTGNCKPCAFLHTKGCENGLRCQFCHSCEAGEKKRRQKERQAATKKLAGTAMAELMVQPVVPELMVQPALHGWYGPAVLPC